MKINYEKVMIFYLQFTRGIAAKMVSPFRRTGSSFNFGSCLGEREIPLDAARLAEW